MGIAIYYILSTISGFALQFLLCRKIKNAKLKYIPTYIVAVGWIFILTGALGVLGNMGDSFYDYKFAALIFAVFFLPPTLGIGAADIYVHISKRKE